MIIPSILAKSFGKMVLTWQMAATGSFGLSLMRCFSSLVLFGVIEAQVFLSDKSGFTLTLLAAINAVPKVLILSNLMYVATSTILKQPN
jgi:hypothetical protein